MTDRTHPVCNRPCRGSFVLWGWALLMLVLLSATPTGAQPRTRLIGSAFDPAAISVTVAPTARDDGAAIRRVRPAGPTDDASDAPSLTLAVAADHAAGQIRAPAAAPAVDDARPDRDTPPAPLRAHPPRAPPVPES